MQPRRHENTKKTFGTKTAKPAKAISLSRCDRDHEIQPRKHESTKTRRRLLGTRSCKARNDDFSCHAANAPAKCNHEGTKTQNTKKTFWNAKTAKPAKTISLSRCDRTHGRSPPSSPKTQRRGQSVRRGGACDNGLLRRPLRVEPNPSCLRAFVVCLFRDFVVSCFRVFVVAFVIGIAACVS